jgi:hypothetical protein
LNSPALVHSPPPNSAALGHAPCQNIYRYTNFFVC